VNLIKEIFFLLITCPLLVYPARFKYDIDSLLIYADTVILSNNEKEVLLYDIVNKIDSLNYIVHKPNIYRRLGTMYMKQGRFKSALFYLNKSLRLADSIDYKEGRASTLNQLGKLYFYQDKFDTALFYFKRSEVDNKEVDSKVGLGDVYLNISNAAYMLDSLPLAYEYVIEALRMADSVKSLENAGVAQQLLYHILREDSLGLGSISELNNLYNRFLGTENKELLLTLSENIASEYLIRDELDSAIKYYTIAADYANQFQDFRYHSELKDRILDLTKLSYDQKLKHEKASQVKTFWISALVIILLVLAVVIALIYRNISQRRKLTKQELELQKQEVNRLLKEQELRSTQAMLEGQDKERKRIAEELHDRLGGILSTVKLHFGQVQDRIDQLQHENNEQYQKAEKLLDEAVAEVRRISHDLYSGVLTKFGLKAALEQLKETVEGATKVKFDFMGSGLEKRLEFEMEINLYRIIQELTANTLKHAQASAINVQLNRNNGSFTLMCEDYGKGFIVNQKRKGMGLNNIYSRAERLGGKVHIDSQPGHGMTAIIEIPVL